MSSLNKIVINGGKALDSRRSLASRAGSRRNTPAVSSARNSQRSRRNMEMLVKRVETRSRIIKKAFGEIKKVHPNEMSYESLKNCVVRYKLPLSKDAVRMLFEHARSANSLTEGSQQKASMLDLGKTIVSGRGENFSFRSINADQRGGIPAAEKQSSSKKKRLYGQGTVVAARVHFPESGEIAENIFCGQVQPFERAEFHVFRSIEPFRLLENSL